MCCKRRRRQSQGCPADALTIHSATADKGYYAVQELQQLQREGIRTVISDPVKNRKLENVDREDARVVRKAKRSACSKSGKALLRRRGTARREVSPIFWMQAERGERPCEDWKT